jgi:hypothetical protein
MTNAALLASGLSIMLWDLALIWACNTYNRNPNQRAIASPFEDRTGQKTDFRFRHPFGARGTVILANTAKIGEHRSAPIAFVGYSNSLAHDCFKFIRLYPNGAISRVQHD